MNTSPKLVRLVITAAAPGLVAAPAAAQNHAARAVRIVAPFPAGGSPHPVARILAQKPTEMNGRLLQIVRQQDVKERSAGLGLEPAGTSPQHYATVIKSEIDRVARVAKAIGLQPE